MNIALDFGIVWHFFAGFMSITKPLEIFTKQVINFKMAIKSSPYITLFTNWPSLKALSIYLLPSKEPFYCRVCDEQGVI